MPEEIERLIVAIEANVADLVENTADAVDQAEDSLKGFERTGKKAFDDTGKSAKGFESVLGNLKAGVASFIAAFAVGKVVDFFKKIGGAAVAANAQFETFETQFTTLLGSTGAAKQRLEDLAKFGVETPFELPDLVQASRQLQVFGGTALATGDNLRMIGDIAAGVNQPFQDVAFWVGRMYDAMQNGQPFGEASARLQEMGALSGDTRRQLEQMQKAGKDGSEIFAVFADRVGGKFAGNMERLSKTFQGVTSNLADFQGNLLRVGGAPLFDEVRQSAIDLLDVLDENAPALEEIATQLGEVGAMVIRFFREDIFGGFKDNLPIKQLGEFVDWLKRTVQGAMALVSVMKQSGGSLGAIGSVLGVLLTPLKQVFDLFSHLPEALMTAAQGLALVQAGWAGIRAALEPTIQLVSQFAQGLLAFGQADFAGAIEKFQTGLSGLDKGLIDVSAGRDATIQSIGDSFDAIQKAFADEGQDVIPEDVFTPPENITEPMEEAGNEFSDLLDKLAKDFIDATEDRNEKLAELEADLGQKLTEIDEDYTKDREKILEKQAGKLKDLDQDTADARSEAFKKARADEKKLAQSTSQKLADERQDYQREEKRETEDHLKEMQRLRLSFLDDLEDAVKSRDARAVRDLQRRFQREQQERTDDFETKHSRDREDQDLNLQQIRDNSRQRAEEIQQNLDDELQKIAENEQKKRDKINESTQEQLAELDTKHQEEIAKAQEDFDTKQAQLDEALQKRLETTAKSLSDNEDLNAESAQRILEILNEQFGVGGNIDKLMSDFEARRSKRLVIKMDFEGVKSNKPKRNRGASASDFEGALPSQVGAVPSFAEGGTLMAKPPGTLALFGEKVPEVAHFTPMSKIGSESLMKRQIDLSVKFSGSAPPGIRSGDRDQIAQVLTNALREAGVMRN